MKKYLIEHLKLAVGIVLIGCNDEDVKKYSSNLVDFYQKVISENPDLDCISFDFFEENVDLIGWYREMIIEEEESDIGIHYKHLI